MRRFSRSGSLILGVVFMVAVILAWQPARAQDADLSRVAALERTLIQAIEEAESSVVSIARIKNGPEPAAADRFRQDRRRFPHRNLPPETDRPSSPDFIPNEFGSGILVAPLPDPDKRFILTNYHVIQGGPVVGSPGRESEARLYVRCPNRRGYYAEIFAADPRSDLAVLTVDEDALDGPGSELQPMTLGNASGVRKGQIVLTLGNPYAIARDGSASASWGILSNIARRPQPIESSLFDPETRKEETIHHLGTLLQVDTRLNLGTSGGAVVNLNGELIGIVTSLAALEGYETSVGYAIPLDNTTRRIIDTLARGHEVEYGFLGVVPRDLLPEALHKLSGDIQQASAAMIDRVFPNSPASRSGLANGDIVLSVNGEPVYDRYDLMRLISGLGPGTNAHLRLWRERARDDVQLSVTLGKWPVINEEEIIAPNPRYPSWRGLRVDHPTSRLRYLQRPIHRFPQAVVITEVAPQSRAELAGLQPGDFITHVNQVPVQTPDEFYQSLPKGDQTDVTLSLLDRGRVAVPK